METSSLLVLHSTIVGCVLVYYAYRLYSAGLFRWTGVGFWSWSSLILYLVINPLFAILSDRLIDYEIRLNIAGGINRVMIILLATILGIALYFESYLRAKTHPVTWRLINRKNITLPQFLFVLLITFLAGYSLLAFRSQVFPIYREVNIIGGRFFGSVTGYEYTLHMFTFVPVVLLILSQYKMLNLFGIFLGALYIVLSLPHGWSRFSIVSMMLAISITLVFRSTKRFPNLSHIFLIFLGASMLQIRGHTVWSLQSILNETIELIRLFPHNIASVFGSVDAAMLSTWYLESYVKDSITGFDFGLRTVNYLLTGWIPSQIYPGKYFLIDWLNANQTGLYSPTIINLLYGSKSTLLGGFYADGGIVGVCLLSAFVGYLSKKFDGMLDDNSTMVVKAVGISWLSVLWMVWGSRDYWGLTVMGVILLPGLLLWLISKKAGADIEKLLNPSELKTDKVEKYLT